MKRIFLTGVLFAACGLALAKLPAPDDAAKAKAAETAAKAAWQAKQDAYLLCKSQDKVVAAYQKTSGKSAPKSAKPAAAPVAAASAAAPAASGTTPVAYKPPAPCVDPGPFAANPPSVKPNSAEMAPTPKKKP